ncbi:MAG: hypothetical protein GTO45_30320 [Candidatus Aminicenantes bacterium]|nr:hypothetical protein [Candidatus Aminicenantes bacterium]NIM83089.1 hypothetical protein [Candidatus Aminicenantes bacterium]NIN22468.1 hypothetical protein [Candidatus Aminicenantes bacterium]NIN46236.1 hypothetical protein [Candidatus Aminicenantes bacterium]NIN89073.1 hypothetical protein [Candidatus Aminicenantes bacterium]
MMGKIDETFLDKKAENSSSFTKQLNDFKNNYEELVQAIQEKKVSFFVGSGISLGTPTKISTAKDLGKRFMEKFGDFDWWQKYFNPHGPTRVKRFYSPHFEIPRLEEIAQLFWERNKFKNFIDFIMSEKDWQTKPTNICHTVLCELLIEEFCEGVLTTNLDDRIEHEYKNITMGKAPNVISHDDFISEIEHRCDIYKVHGCLCKCPTKKYLSIWSTCQLKSSSWPSGVNFADGIIRDLGQRHHLVFVGFNTYTEYLKRTLEEIMKINSGEKFYCVLPEDFDSIDSNFKKMINLIPERHIKSLGEDFFKKVRQIVFEELLNRLFRNKVYPEREKFYGGSEQSWKIGTSDFDETADSLKREIIAEDRERFQKFLQQVLQKEGFKNKYVSFEDFKDQIAKLLFFLIILRFNYTRLTFCTVSFRHLFMDKNNQKLSVLIINGKGYKPIKQIVQELNRNIEKDPELQNDIRNVFIYDAIKNDSRQVCPEEVGDGRLVGVTPYKITNPYFYKYFILTSQEVFEFLEVPSLKDFKKKLDNLSWRREKRV